MNFLAHLYLSGDNPKVKVGNFIGDFVKGKNLTERFDAEIAKGIALHREIDWFTDTHAVVKQSKDRLRPKYRHYSGVIVDIFYDHFLAKNWALYSNEPLEKFTTYCYKVFENYLAIMPEQNQRMYPYIKKENWLLNYGKPDGIRRSFEGMARRIGSHSKLEQAPDAPIKNYQSFEKM